MRNPFRRKKPQAPPAKKARKARKYRVASKGRQSFGLSTSAIQASGISWGDAGVDDETFAPDNRPISQVIASDLQRDRGISRMMERENDYYVRYLTEQEENIVGGAGFRFQSQILRRNGSYNKRLNDKVEAWWKIQTSAKNYTVEGEHSSLNATAADKLILKMVVRDGFCIIKPIENFDNATGFAIQILPGDVINHTLCEEPPSPGGNRIQNGVEIDQWGRVVRYHLNGGSTLAAKDAIVPFMKSHSGQYLGLPWARAVAKTLHGLDQYEESVMVTAREAACKALFVTQDAEVADGEFTEQDLPSEVTAGSTTVLEPGQNIAPYDPSQPTNQYNPFRQGVLMRAASGLNMSYQSLSGDLSGGNFASQRVGLLDEREIWKGRQTWFISAVKIPIFERALAMALLKLDLPITTGFDAVNFPFFRGRRWAWVDPQKDIQAAKIAIDNGLTSRAKVISDSDSDLDEEGVLQEIKRGQDIEEEMGLEFPERGVIHQDQAGLPTNIENISDEQAQAQ